jgi:TPR repeat protein
MIKCLNEELANKNTEEYYTCCGKSICQGCIYSFSKSGNMGNCPFCKSEYVDKTDEKRVEELMKRVEANDAGATFSLGSYYHKGRGGLLQDHTKAMDLYVRAAELGLGMAHCNLGLLYHEGGDMKKAKFHLEAAAMAGNEW